MFREIASDTLMTLFMPETGGVTSVFISNDPAQNPRACNETIVLIPDIAVISLMTQISRETTAEQKVMECLADLILDEVRLACPRSPLCRAELDNFKDNIPELDTRVLAVGVICAKACDNQCPQGIKSEF